MPTTNPRLDFSDWPRFDTVQPEHVKTAIESLLTAGRELITRLTDDATPATWHDFAGALSDGLEPVSYTHLDVYKRQCPTRFRARAKC